MQSMDYFYFRKCEKSFMGRLQTIFNRLCMALIP